MISPRHRRFVAEYVRDFNATQAAIRAGYSRRYGRQLLHIPEIAAEIETAVAAEQRRIRLDADRVVLELMRVAFSDIRTFLVAGEGGAVTLRPSETLTEHEAAAVAYLSRGSRNHGPSIRLHGKKHALRALARHLGLDDQRHFVDLRVVTAETARIRAALLAAAGIAEPKTLPAPAAEGA